jgi:hypothetical protein
MMNCGSAPILKYNCNFAPVFLDFACLSVFFQNKLLYAPIPLVIFNGVKS